MSSSEKIEKIKQSFPIVMKIEDPELRETVIQCWVKMWEESEWEDLNDCPFTPPFPDISLVQHINCVGELILSAADIMEKHHSRTNAERE